MLQTICNNVITGVR